MLPSLGRNRRLSVCGDWPRIMVWKQLPLPSFPAPSGFLEGSDACFVVGGDGTLLSVMEEAVRLACGGRHQARAAWFSRHFFTRGYGSENTGSFQRRVQDQQEEHAEVS